MAGLVIKLIVGLGNPGPEHAATRHNAGFWCVDLLARQMGASWRAHARYQGEVARGVLAGQELWLLKPMTYMNRSGLSVQAMAEYFQIDPAQVLTVHDDLDLPLGALRLKQGGGAGGHNGLKDLISHLGDSFWRLRVGIGHPGQRQQVIDYVLQRASKAEQACLDEAIDAATQIVPDLLSNGAEKVMNKLHRRVPAAAGELSGN
jgi:PTH1 family peptidyl-tRNA hydrolase